MPGYNYFWEILMIQNIILEQVQNLECKILFVY